MSTKPLRQVARELRAAIHRREPGLPELSTFLLEAIENIDERLMKLERAAPAPTTLEIKATTPSARTASPGMAKSP